MRRAKGSNVIMRVRFLESGNTTEAHLSSVTRGSVKDPGELIYGLGYIKKGAIATYGNNLYKLWFWMMRRCYGPKQHKCYDDVTVCPEWWCFNNFAEDVIKFPNYVEWLMGGYDLDKDLRVPGAKQYSPSTCSFVKASKNRCQNLKQYQ